MNAQFADNPAFLEYQDLLIQVQHAICQGDNQATNRLCEASEDLGQSLSLAEIQWLQWLSSDLEMLCGEEMLQPAEQTQEEYAQSLVQAWLTIEEQPEKILALLRRNHGYLSQSRVAYARAWAYGILGYKPLRHVFLQCASTLEPENFAYKIFLLDEAKTRGDLIQALQLAQLVFGSPTGAFVPTNDNLALQY